MLLSIAAWHTLTHTLTHTRTHTSKVEKISLGFVLLAKAFPWYVQVAPKLVGENLKVACAEFSQLLTIFYLVPRLLIKKHLAKMTIDKISST